MVEGAQWQHPEGNLPPHDCGCPAVDGAVAAADHKRLAAGLYRGPHRRVALLAGDQPDARLAPGRGEDLLQLLGRLGSGAMAGAGIEHDGHMTAAHDGACLLRRWRNNRSPNATALTQTEPMA